MTLRQTMKSEAVGQWTIPGTRVQLHCHPDPCHQNSKYVVTDIHVYCEKKLGSLESIILKSKISTKSKPFVPPFEIFLKKDSLLIFYTMHIAFYFKYDEQPGKIE